MQGMLLSTVVASFPALHMGHGGALHNGWRKCCLAPCSPGSVFPNRLYVFGTRAILSVLHISVCLVAEPRERSGAVPRFGDDSNPSYVWFVFLGWGWIHSSTCLGGWSGLEPESYHHLCHPWVRLPPQLHQHHFINTWTNISSITEQPFHQHFNKHFFNNWTTISAMI
jgi:hypothetical protein